ARKRRWLLAGLGAVLLLGFVAFIATGGPTKPAGNQQELSLVGSIRKAAASFSKADGPRWRDAAAGLQSVADAVEKGGGPAEADNLLTSLRGWRASGALSGSA